ncbi:MAG: hypothetical protein ACLP8S_32825 [Solirubrobacteraceae bacterium]
MSRPLVPAQRAREELRRADQRWRAAIRALECYSDRLRELAAAAEEEGRALTLADLANVPWRPVEGARTLKAPYELTNDHRRPGPPALWARFDDAITQLGLALESDSIATVADAFAELSTVLVELADAHDADQRELLDRQAS